MPGPINPGSGVYPLQPIATTQYKLFLKRTLVEALRAAFAQYTDTTIDTTKIDIEYAEDKGGFPSIVVKFYERKIENAGVGHIEYGPDVNNPGKWLPYFHRIYQGDIEFEIFGLSSYDRDIVGDALVEVMMMGPLTPSGLSFQQRLYNVIGTTPFADQHFVALNTDELSGYGETQMIAPWIPEDVLVYQASYRVPVLGEFYSIVPPGSSIVGTGLVSEVDIYPWDPSDPLDTDPSTFPGGVIPQSAYITITGTAGSWTYL